MAEMASAMLVIILRSFLGVGAEWHYGDLWNQDFFLQV